MKWLKFNLLLILISIFFNQCATVFGGRKQPIFIYTNVAGATVYINGDSVDATPCTIYVNKRHRPEIEISKPGYSSENLFLSKIFNETAFLNCFNACGWAIDFGFDNHQKFAQPDTVILRPVKSKKN